MKNKNTKVITEYHYDTPFHYLFNCKNYSNKNSYYIVSHVTVFPSACWDDDDGYSI